MVRSRAQLRGILGTLSGLVSWLVLAPTNTAHAQSMSPLVSMRDGVRLVTDVYLPEGPGPWPVVLYRTPYVRTMMTDIAEAHAAIGLAAIVQSMRGRHGSEGTDRVFLSDGDGPLKDGYDAFAWTLTQPWCNGKIGSAGGSALGITQYMQAASAPPGLLAISPVIATPNFYQDAIMYSGVFRENLVEGWLARQGSSAFLEEIAAHPYEDSFWKSSQTKSRYGAVTAAGVHEGGWFDVFQQGILDGFVGYQHRGGVGARGKQKLIMGPWTHGGYRKSLQGELQFPANAALPPYPSSSEVMFNDLLGVNDPNISDSFADIPAVQYYVMGDVNDASAPGNEWRIADDWPPVAAPVRLHLQPSGALAESCPDDTTIKADYQYDPADPSPTICGRNLLLAAGPCDQQLVEERSDILSYTGPVLGAPLEITGRVRAHLFVDIDQPDTDLMVRLSDVYPDGRSMLIADGATRLAARGRTDGLQHLSPGEIVEAVVDLWSTSIILNRGHRLRISVTSSNYPRFAANRNNGADYPASTMSGDLTGAPVTVSVHHSRAYPSYIELPDPTRQSADFISCDETLGSGGAGSGGRGTGGGSVGGGSVEGLGSAAPDENFGANAERASPQPLYLSGGCACSLERARPEPTSWLLGLTLAALTARRRRRKAQCYGPPCTR